MTLWRGSREVRRRPRRWRPAGAWAGVIALAVVAGVAFGIRLTGARPPAGTIRPAETATSPQVVPACTHIGVSWSIYAVDTMPGALYALVFRNTGAGPCVLAGWPRVTVPGPAGLTGVRVFDGSASGGFGPIQATRVVLRPGDEAAADVLIGTPADGLGCVAPTWSVTPPGGGRAAILSGPAPLGPPEPTRPVIVCANGSVEVSPVYPGAYPIPGSYPAPNISPPYREAVGPEPPACAAAALRASVVNTVTGQQGSVLILRLSASGPECTLRGTSAPTIRLHEVGGAEPMGKIFPTPESQRATQSVLVIYGNTLTTPTAVRLSGSTSVAAVLLLPRPGSCSPLTSLTIYPGPIGLGPGLTVAIGGAVQACGRSFVLGFLPVSPAGEAAALARQALAAAADRGL